MFTDAGRKSRTAAVTWHDNCQWKHKILQAQPRDSLQTLELSAVVWALMNWLQKSINVVSDSLYVAGLVEKMEDTRIREINNRCLFELLTKLQRAITIRDEKYAVIHMRSHKWAEGLGEGNQKAGDLVTISVPVNKLSEAREA